MTFASLGKITVATPGTPVQFSPLGAPGTITATPSTTGGTLATGTYYYRVTSVSVLGESTGSPEASAAVTGPTGSVALSWSAVAGATSYKIYRGTSAGAENTFFTSASASFTDTGAAGTAGTVPTVNSAAASIVTNKVILHPIPANAGTAVAVGNSSVNANTYAGAVAVFTKPTATGVLDRVLLEFEEGSGDPIDLSRFYVDATTAGDGVIVSYAVV